MKKIHILLAEDQRIMREGVRSLLQGNEDMEVIAEAHDGKEALHLVRERDPDVVLMDISMPGMSGIEAAREITQAHPQVRVIMLSQHASEVYVLQALRADVSGYLTKSTDARELTTAIRAVAAGEIYLTPVVNKYVVADYVRRVSGSGTVSTELTERQRDILQLIAQGHSTKEIANILVVSIKTVETHRAQVMERLDIRDVAGLVRYAIRMGLITAEE